MTMILDQSFVMPKANNNALYVLPDPLGPCNPIFNLAIVLLAVLTSINFNLID